MKQAKSGSTGMVRKAKVRSTVYTILAVIICFIMLIPVYLLAKTSLSTSEEVLVQHPTFLIHHITFEHWIKIFNSGKLWAPLLRSVITASATTVIALIVVVAILVTLAQTMSCPNSA